MSADLEKKAAGEAAAALVRDGSIVGLGTGSTAAHFVQALARRVKAEGLNITGVPTSVATETLARSLGLEVKMLDEVDHVDLTVDGADEIGPGLALIKGGGAALLREKLVWEASARCVVIADAAKDVAVLGRFALPVEVVAFGHRHTARRIAAAAASVGVTVEPQLRVKDGVVVTTDTGQLIYDLACGAIHEPAALAAALKSVTGVIEHGLFLGLAEIALVGETGAGGEVAVRRMQP
jgi:ribose 5-phosphate isomerase A